MRKKDDMVDTILMIVVVLGAGLLLWSKFHVEDTPKVEPVHKEPKVVPVNSFAVDLKDHEQKIKSLQDNYRELQSKISRLEQALHGDAGDTERHNKEIADLRNLIAVQHAEIRKLQQRPQPSPVTVIKFEGTLPIDVKSLPPRPEERQIETPPTLPKDLRKRNGVKKADLFTQSAPK